MSAYLEQSVSYQVQTHYLNLIVKICGKATETLLTWQLNGKYVTKPQIQEKSCERTDHSGFPR